MSCINTMNFVVLTEKSHDPGKGNYGHHAITIASDMRQSQDIPGDRNAGHGLPLTVAMPLQTTASLSVKRDLRC